MAKKTSSIGSKVRNKLADITNSKTIKHHMEDQKPSETLQPNKNVIDQLVKENMSLMKLIVERNKIIDLSGAELQKLRASIQKLQLQNWHLAQSNSRFLAEVNVGRDRIKSLEHEIECKQALLKAKCLKVEEGEKATAGHYSSHSVKSDTNKACNGNTNHARRIKSQSMGPCTSYATVEEDKEKVENKRRCVRRQSARFRYQMRDPDENLFEIEDVKFPATGEEERKNSSMMSSSSPRWEEAPAPLERSSIGRPSRRAAEKIQSYKEVPLNIKMRRKE